MSAYEIKSYEDIRDKLRVRLMDMKSNAMTLQDVIYQAVGCGLALTAYMKLPQEVADDSIANVPRRMTQLKDVNAEMIMEDALAGSVAANRPMLCALQEIIVGTSDGIEPENLLKSGNVPSGTILVLTTEGSFLGAAAFFYPGMQEKIAEIVGGDYYVLPSSVHEVLIVPENCSISPGKLCLMVKNINETEVAAKDRLCSRVFRYDSETQTLSIAADPDRRRDMER